MEFSNMHYELLTNGRRLHRGYRLQLAKYWSSMMFLRASASSSIRLSIRSPRLSSSHTYLNLSLSSRCHIFEGQCVTRVTNVRTTHNSTAPAFFSNYLSCYFHIKALILIRDLTHNFSKGSPWRRNAVPCKADSSFLNIGKSAQHVPLEFSFSQIPTKENSVTCSRISSKTFSKHNMVCILTLLQPCKSEKWFYSQAFR